MKKITLIALLFFIKSFSQKINNVNHGEAFERIKELTPREYNRNCKGFIHGSRYMFPEMFSSSATFNVNGYAESKFESQLQNKNYSLWSKYRESLNKLGVEFQNVQKRTLYNDFENCSERAFEYIKLHIIKFELTAEYYKNLYNYEYELAIQNVEIENNLKFLVDSLNIVRNELDNEIQNDNVLLNLKNKRKNEIQKLKINSQNSTINNFSNFDDKTASIENNYNNDKIKLEIEQNSEIKKLPVENYNLNKQKVIRKFEPRFEELRIRKNKQIQAIIDEKNEFISSQERENKIKLSEMDNQISKLELTIDNEILLREKYLKDLKENRLKEIDDLQIEKSKRIKRMIKEKYNLDSQLDSHEEAYITGIKNVDAEIEVLLSKNSTPNTLKKGLRDIIGN